MVGLESLVRVRSRLDSTLFLILGILLIIAMLIGLITLLDIRRQSEIYWQGLEERALLMSSTLEDVLVDPLYFIDVDQLRYLSNAFEGYPEIRYMQIFTPEGRLLVGSDNLEYPIGFIGDQFDMNALQSGKTILEYQGESLDVSRPISVGNDLIGVVQFGLDAASLRAEIEGIVLEHVVQGLVLMAVAAPLSYLVVWYFVTQRKQAEEAVHLGQLQAFSQRLVEAQESDRRYIARELHDEAGQALTSMMVGLRLLEREANSPVVTARVAELKGTTGGIMENLHRLAMNLRPTSLDHLGLVSALRQYVNSFGRQHSMTAQFQAVGLEDPRLPSEVETSLYRIVQEGLTNVARHARATRAGVLLERRDARVIVIIEDDGVGFDLKEPQSRDCLGLFGMQERVEMLHGTLTIESAVGAGTTLFVEVPYGHSDSHRG